MSSTINRRHWILSVGSAAACGSAWTSAGGLTWGAYSERMLRPVIAYALDFQTEGKVVLGPDEEPKPVAFTVSSKQNFSERLIVQDDIRLACRVYDRAELEKKFGTLDSQTVAIETGQAVLAFAETKYSGRMEFRCKDTKLQSGQWNLLQVQLSPMWMEELAAALFADKAKLQIGDKFVVDAALAARLFCLEEVTATSLTVETEKANDSQAVLKLAGDVEGRSLDVKALFRVNSSLRAVFQDRQFSQVRASFFEQRTKGVITPAYSATTKMKLDQVENKTEISESLIKELMAEISQAAVLQFESDKNEIQLQHGSQWHLLMDQPGAIVWRLISGGEPLTQCNLLLPATKASEKLSLDDFVEKVTESLTDNEVRIVAKETIPNVNGRQIFRVQAAGKEAGVELNWIYYYIATADGRRAQMVFTTDEGFLEAMGDSDRLMAETLQWSNSKVASRSTNTTQPQR